ncbi:MAG: transcriptional regulator [Actinomycetota bacterium]|nr:transcriptional regulator [Actinomycetota bacterium]
MGQLRGYPRHRLIATPDRIRRSASLKLARAPAVALDLLGGFALRLDGRTTPLPMPARRVLVFVALRRRALARSYVAQSLWANATESHADGNLRSALWSLGRAGRSLLDVRGGQLALDAGVEVDLYRSAALARSLLTKDSTLEPRELDEQGLCADLLPDWYDEWLLPERESYKQLRLHALEELCIRLISLRSFGRAVQAGLAAVSAEPLRESANAVLIKAYLAEGNTGEALRQYEHYRDLLRRELDVAPTAAIGALLEAAFARR